MKIKFENGNCYVDNHRFAKYHGTNLQSGTYPVEARWSHSHSRVLPLIEGVGLVGFSNDCAIVLGSVRNRADVLGDEHLVKVLADGIEVNAELGHKILAEIV